MTQRKIKENEQEICGEWMTSQGMVYADDNCRRIETLIKEHLQELGSDASGWDRLYLDPDDGRYWELIYLNSEQHGGGAPCLKYITDNEARIKYQNIVGLR